MPKNQNSIVPVEVQTKAKKDAAALFLVANKIVVTTASEEEKAYDALTKIKTALKTIETARKKITAPLNQAVKAANSMFKTLSEPFTVADSIIRDKIMGFRQEQQEKAEKEQERREKIQASHEERGHKTYDLPEVEPEVAEKTVTTKRWAIRIINPKKLPEKILRQLIQTDEGYEIMEKWLRKKMREAPKGKDNKPLIEISGTEVYQEKGLRV